MIALAQRAERYVPGLVWTRSRSAVRGTRPALDRDTIVRGAIELLDRDGLEGLSMRHLGAHLSCAATTIYWHVANKEEVLDLAFDEVMGELADPGPTGDWRAEVTARLQDLRAMMLRHRWHVRLYGSRLAFGPRSLRFHASLLGALVRAGFKDALLDQAQAALIHYVVGSVTSELNIYAWRSLPPEELAPLTAYMNSAIEAYPEYKQHMENYLYATLPETVVEGRFSTALQSLLDGLAMRLEGK